MNEHKGWIGVDLDGTLAHYDKWRGSKHIGKPVPLMLQRVKNWIDEGRDVRIFTARVSPQALRVNNETLLEVKSVIETWCFKNVGRILPVTHEKDMAMVELWDDRAIQVIPNTGRRADGKIMV